MTGKHKQVEEPLRGVGSFKESVAREIYDTRLSPSEQIDSSHHLINWKEWTQ